MIFFFKQKTAYEMRISDWSSDVCSSDLTTPPPPAPKTESAGSTKSTERPDSEATRPHQPTQRQAYQEPPQPYSGSSGGKWILGIAAVFGLLLLIGQSNTHTPSLYPSLAPAPSYTLPPQRQAPRTS